ncbi:MAG TPA: PH domain-containing protein, partial [Candidatus Bilamarchaeaceae archaeon]|nr:PH domain-containing protein [Candidatus Bilamarchaeaceae archaeon]
MMPGKIPTTGRIMYAKALLLAILGSYAWMEINRFFTLPAPIPTYGYYVIWGLMLLAAIAAFVRSRLQTLEVTGEGVTSRTGIINVKTRFIPFSKVDNVHVERNIFDRIFMVGKIRVDTLASSGMEISMGDIPSKDLEEALSYIQSRIHRGGTSEGRP